MQNLSLDDIFCVMEFLPSHDLANALMTCKEWYSLDQFEPFWKTILQHYLTSNIILLYGKIVGVHKVSMTIKNYWDLPKVKKTLKTGNTKEKKALVSSLRSLKTKKNSKLFTIDRSILNMFLTSYDIHILQDKTASRESLKKFIIHDEEVGPTDEEMDEFDNGETSSESKRPAVIGKRFKYLMEKQLYSKRTVIISTFFNINKSNYYHRADEAFILSLLSTCLGKEYRSETCSVEDYQLGKEAFSLFFKFHEQLDYADKCWASILDLCVMSLNEFVKVEDYEEVLKKILEVKYTFSIDLSLVEYIFFQTDCCTNGLLPLITQILEKNRMEGSFTNYMMYQSIYDMTDELKLAKQVADYFTYLEKFRTREQIMQSHLNDFIISSMGRLPDTYIDELLKLYPIDLNSVSFSDCARFQVTEKILEIANRRGIYYPLETVEKAIVDIYYTRSSYNTIKYIMEHYNLDIYEIEKRTKFFSRFLGSLLRYDINTEQLKSNIETIFPNSPIEWKKLASIHDGINEITERIISLVQTCCERPSGEELLYLRECFTPNIFDLNVMVRSLSNATPACSLTLYNLTMYSEDEKLSDHMDRMLNEQDFSHFTGIDFANYDPSDPRYLVAVYRFVHQ